MFVRKKSKVTRILAVILAFMLVVYNLPVMAITNDATQQTEGSTLEQAPEQVLEPAPVPELEPAPEPAPATEPAPAPAPEPAPEPEKVTYNVTVNQSGSGKVEINSSEYTEPVSVVEGEDVEVNIIPEAEYEINSVTIGGELKTVSDKGKFTGSIPAISEHTTIEVEFVKKTYSITYEAYRNGTVTGSTGEAISLDGGINSILPNANASFTVTPDPGYHIDKITIDDVEINLKTDLNGTLTGSGYTYTFKNVVDHHKVNVKFAINKHTITFNYNSDLGDVKDADKNEIITSAGGSITVDYGSEPSILISPKTGYHIKSVKFGDKELVKATEVIQSTVAREFKLPKVTEDQSVVVTFEINTYEVKAAVIGGYGEITPSSTGVSHNGDVTFTITPQDNSYQIATFTVNGVPVDSYTENKDGERVTYTYTLSDIQGPADVVVGFEGVQVLEGTWDKYVSITPTSGHLVDSYFDEDDNQVLVYSTDAAVVITPNNPYGEVDISRSFEESVSITSSTTIKKIIVRSSAGIPGLNRNKRVSVDLPGDLVIAFDKKSPSVQTPSVDGNNKETINGSLWFSDAVSVSFGIDNIKESVGNIDYSSEIANVYYRNMADPDDKGTKLESENGVYSFKTIDDDYQGQYKIWAEDKAGNVSAEQIVPIHIDKTKPKLAPGQAVTIEKINDNLVAEIINFLTFGTFYNKGLKVTVKVSDEASGIKDILLLTSDEKVVSELVDGSFIKNGLTAQAQFIIDGESFNGTLKAMVTDKVNNQETYEVTSQNSNINPNGNGIIMIDRKAPTAEIQVNHEDNVISFVREDQTEFYSQDVEIGVQPHDADSGVNAVTIDINDQRHSDYDFSTETETQKSPTLAPIATETPAGEHKAYEVSVNVKDHAGNQSEEKTKSIVIDEEVPTLAPGKSVTVREISLLDSLMKFLPFGSFFTKGFEVTVKVEDKAAGIKNVSLIADPVNPSDEKVVPELVSETYSSDSLTGEVTFKLDAESFEGHLSVEVTDNVNNKKSYAITNENSNTTQDGKGLFMIDGVAPSAKINVTHGDDVDFYEGVHVSTGEPTEFYSEDVQVDVEANDPHSGVNKVTIDINNKEYKEYDFSSLSERQKNPSINPIQTSSLVEEGRLFNVSVEVEDNAGNTNKEEVVKRTLYIDEKDPTLSEGKDSVHFEVVNENSIARFLNYLTFGTFFNKEIKITANVKDDASGIKDIKLIAAQEGTNGKKVINPEKIEKDALTAVAQFRFDAASFNGTFSVEVTDNVNNKSDVPYLVTNANSNIAAETSGVVMIEKNKPTAAITVSPENGRDSYVGIEETTGKETEFYSGVVTFNVDVEDTDSGINAVVIKVNGKEILTEADKYKYHYDAHAKKQTNPKINSFSSKQLSDIGIHVNENGSYDVSVEVIDNAGNANQLEKTIFIDSTNPAISGFTFTAEGEKSGNHGDLKDIIELEDYGFYFKKTTQVTVKAVDPDVPNEATTQVKSMIIYLQDYENGNFYSVPAAGLISLVDESEIANIKPVPTTSEVTFNVPASFKGRIFAKAIDHVDNMGEFETPKGAIIEDKAKHDSEKEHITFDRQKTTYKDNKNLDLYANNVPVKLTVKDTYSGLSKVEWSVVAPNDRAQNQVGNTTEIDHEKTFKKDNQIDGWLVTKTDKNLVQEMTKTITVNNDSNGIVVKVKITDRSGNTSEDEITFSIDKTLPTIKVTYDNNTADPQNADYFKENRTATIVITERNFKASDVVHLITNTDGAVPALSGCNTVVNSVDPNKTTHTATVRYTADGDYTFDISYRDNAQNAAAPVAQDKFTIDKTKPVINVSYNNNAAANGNYYKASRTATISITEHNFETSRIKVTGTASDKGAAAAFPAVSTWTTRGDVHTATIQYSADAQYSFDIEYSDMAENVADDYATDTFIVDQTVPELTITGVLDQTANNGDVIPVIAYSDTNFNKNQVSISLKGSNRGSVKLNGNYSNAANGQVYTFKNFEKTKEVDDLYTLSASLTDFAGNVSTKTITFSVNRFGSVYTFDEDLKSIDGKFVQKEKDVIVTETNVDNLKPESITIKMTKNGTPSDLVKGKDFTISETGGKGKWSQYTYVVNKELFAGDGRYTVAIYSEDAAGNINENIDETKKAEISFGIDKTKPVIVPIDIESGEQYPVDNKDVTISIKDNLVLEGAAIYLNDKKVEHQENGENFTFSIPNSNEKQEVKIVAVDAAGNELTKGVNDLIVSTNFLVRWYNNAPLFAGSLGGIGGLGIALAGLFVYRKQKKQPVEE